MNLVRIHYADKVVVRAKSESQRRNYYVAWKHLEEAHILAQPYPAMHAYVHWEMLMLASKEKNVSELLGQILRLFLAAPSSALKFYPQGNNGRSHIGLFSPVSITKWNEKKLQDLTKLERIRIKNGGVLPKYQRKFPLSRG